MRSRESNPGYFSTSCGLDEIPIWVWEHSHRTVAAAGDSTVHNFGREMVVHSIRMPPNYIFIGRRDVFHAGAFFSDSPLSEKQLQYRIYMVRPRYSLTDGIELMRKFQTRFLINKDWGKSGGTDEQMLRVTGREYEQSDERSRVLEKKTGRRLISLSDTDSVSSNYLGREGIPVMKQEEGEEEIIPKAGMKYASRRVVVLEMQ